MELFQNPFSFHRTKITLLVALGDKHTPVVGALESVPPLHFNHCHIWISLVCYTVQHVPYMVMIASASFQYTLDSQAPLLVISNPNGFSLVASWGVLRYVHSMLGPGCQTSLTVLVEWLGSAAFPLSGL